MEASARWPCFRKGIGQGKSARPTGDSGCCHGTASPRTSVQQVRSLLLWLLVRTVCRGRCPVHTLPVRDASMDREGSPLEKLLPEPFDASRMMCPKKAAAHVSNNGASTPSMYGAMIDLGTKPTLQWAKRRYQWMDWLLSGFVLSEANALTADNVFLEVEHRFSTETHGAKTCPHRRIREPSNLAHCSRRISSLATRLEPKESS